MMGDSKGFEFNTNEQKPFRLQPLTRGIRKHSLVLAGILAGQSMVVSEVLSAPVNGSIDGGTGSINVTGNTTTIDQVSERLAIQWDSFDVAGNERVNFVQPNSSSFVLNRILDQSPSQIHGQIDANGHVLLVNPRGILFSDSATVNVGSLTASGLDVSIDDFMNADLANGDPLSFSGIDDDAGLILNNGIINASSVALLGKHVDNQIDAIVAAEVVSLSAGNSAVLTFDGDGLIGISITEEVMQNELGLDDAVLNSGRITGEQVLMQASTASGLFTNAVNNTGVVRAQAIDTSGGRIRLVGGGARIANTSELNASGDTDGGQIEVIAKHFENTGSILNENPNGVGGSLTVSVDTFGNTGTVQLQDGSATISTGLSGNGGVNRLGDIQSTNSVSVLANTSSDDEFAFSSGKSFQLNDNGSLSIDNYVISGAEAIDATSAGIIQGSNSGNSYSLTALQPNTVTVSGTSFRNVTSVSAGASDSDSVSGDGDWALSGNKAVISSGVAFSGVEAVTATGSDVTLIGQADVGEIYTIVSPGNVGVEGIAFAGIDNVLAGEGANNDSVVGDVNWQLQGIESLSAGSINFSQVESATKTGAAGVLNGADGIGEAYAITAPNTVTAQGVIFTNIDTVNAGEGLNTDTVSGDVNWQLGGFEALTAGSVNFNQVEAAIKDGASGSVTGTDNTGETFNMTAPNTVSVQGVVFSNIDTINAGEGANNDTVSGDANWELKGLEAIQAGNIHFNQVEVVVQSGAAGTLTGEADVGETFTITAPNSVEVQGIAFSNIDTVNAGEGGSDDTVSGEVDWQLNGLEAVSAEGIDFHQIESANTSGSAGTITGEDDVGESFLITAPSQVSVQGVNFSNIDTVNAGEGTHNDTVTGEANWQLRGTESVSSNSILLTQIETAIKTGAAATLSGEADVAETFQIVTANEIDAQGISFSNIGSVDAGGGTSQDVVSGDVDWELENAQTVTAAGIEFSEIELATATGSSSAIQNKTGQVDSVAILGQRQVASYGVTFSGITSVVLEAMDMVSDGGNFLYRLETVSELNVADIDFSGLDFDQFSWGAGDNLGLSDTHQLGGVSIDAKGASLQGSDSSDTFEVLGNQSLGYEAGNASGVVTFTNLSAVDAGAGSSDLVLGGGTWTLLGAEAVASSGINFSDIERVGRDGDTASVVGQDSVAETFSLSGNQRLDVEGIRFRGITSVNAGSGTNDSVVGATDWSLLGEKSVSALGINFTDIEAAGADNDGSTLSGRDGIDDHFDFTSSDVVTAEMMEFRGVSQIDAGTAGIVGDLVTGQNTWQVTGQQSISSGGVVISNVDLVGNLSDTSSLNLRANEDDLVEVLAAANQVKVGDITFRGITTVEGGNGSAIDTVRGTETYSLSAGNNVEVNGVTYAQIDVFGAAGDDITVLGLDDVSEEFQIDGLGEIRVSGQRFLGVASVLGGESVTTSDRVYGAAAYTLIANESVQAQGINFSEIEVVGQLLSPYELAGRSVDSDSYELIGDNHINTLGIDFFGLNRIVGEANDSIVDNGSLTYLLANNNTVEVNDVLIEGVDQSAYNWSADDFLGVTNNHDFSDLTVDAKGATLVGSSAGDVYTITGANSLGYRRSDFSGVESGVVYFENVDRVTSETGVSDTDSVSGTALWTLNGHRSVLAEGITFSDVDVIGLSSDSATIVGQDTVAERFEVIGAGEVLVDGLRFLGNSNISAGTSVGVVDEVVASNTWLSSVSSSEGHWHLTGTGSVQAAGLTFGQVEQVGSLSDGSVLVGRADSDDVFSVDNTGVIGVDGMSFYGIASVSAGNDSGVDHVTGVQEWQLLGDQSVSAAGVQFNQVEQVGTVGDQSLLRGREIEADDFRVVGANLVEAGGMTFVGVDRIEAGTSAADSVHGVSDWSISDTKQLTVSGIVISDIDSAGLDGENNTLHGRDDLVDRFLILNEGQVESAEITFRGVQTVHAGSGAVEDTVVGGNHFDLVDVKQVTAHGILFNDIERVGEAGQTSSLTARNDVADSFVLLGQESFSVADMTFEGVQTVDAGAGIATDTVSGSSEWRLVADNTIEGLGVSFSNLEVAGLNTDSSQLIGRDSVGEVFVISAPSSVNINTLQVVGLNSVVAGNGQGDSVVGSNSWALTGQQSLSASGINFSGIESAGQAGDGAALIAQSNVGETFSVTGGNSVNVAGIAFGGIGSVDAGDGAGIDEVSGASSWSITGQNSLSVSGINFSGIELASGTGADLIGEASVAEEYELIGSQTVRVAGIEFSGVNRVDAGGQASGDVAFGADEWALLADGRVSANDITLENINTFGKSGDSSHLQGLASVGETFQILGVGTVEVNGVEFLGLDSVGAGSESGIDIIVGSDRWAFSDVSTVSASGLSLTGFEQFGSADEASQLVGLDGIDESYVLDEGSQVAVNGFEFFGVERIEAGSGDSDTFTSAGGVWQLLDEDQNGIGESLQLESLILTGIDTVNAVSDARLVGSERSDAFSLDASGIEVSGIRLIGFSDIDAGGGDDSVSRDSSIGSVWTLRDSGNDYVFETQVNSVGVVFSNIEFLENVGTLIGSNLSTTYSLTGADSLTLGSVSLAGVETLSAGAGDDTLVGINADAEWLLNDDGGDVNGFTFSGIENLVGGSGRDVFYLAGGELSSLNAGRGDDSVYLQGGSVIGVVLGEGNDQTFLESALSIVSSIDGGEGSDSLSSSLSDSSWQISSPIDGINHLGEIEFTRFENLNNDAEQLRVNTGLAAAFNNDFIQFSNGLTLGYLNNGDIQFASTYLGGVGISGAVTANRFDVVAQSDIELESTLTTLSVTTQPDTSIDVSILEADDLIISSVNTGSNGMLTLNSQRFGSLIAEERGETHLIARDAVLGTTEFGWNSIGDQLSPLRMDIADTLKIVSLRYVEPEFVSQVPKISAVGERIESLSGAAATQGVKSAVQNKVVEFTQVDPAIFTDVRSYSVGVDAVYSPETRLIAGELIPVDATAAGDRDSSDEAAEETAED